MRRIAHAAFAALFFCAAPTLASEPRLSNEGRAEKLFQSAAKKFDSGDHDGACADFGESLKLGPKLGTLLNLALCHETVGKLVTAWEEFGHAAAWAAQNNQRDRLEFATQHIRALEPRLPRVVLHLPLDRGVTALDLDGEPLPETRWYLPLFLDPGEHNLAVTAPGKQRLRVAFRVVLSPSDQFVEVPSLADDPKTLTSPERPRNEPPASARRTLGFAGLAGGALGLAGGLTFGVLAIAAESRDESVHDFATISTISVGAGAALAAAGLWLLLSGQGR